MPVELRPEPTNPKDSQAIAFLCLIDGKWEKIGHVVHDLSEKRFIFYIWLNQIHNGLVTKWSRMACWHCHNQRRWLVHSLTLNVNFTWKLPGLYNKINKILLPGFSQHSKSVKWRLMSVAWTTYIDNAAFQNPDNATVPIGERHRIISHAQTYPVASGLAHSCPTHSSDAVSTTCLRLTVMLLKLDIVYSYHLPIFTNST